jgi:hypothetical protein
MNESLDREHWINSMPTIGSNSTDMGKKTAQEIPQLRICVGLTQREAADDD